MDPKIRVILLRHLCVIIDTVGHNAVLIVVVGSGIVFHWMFSSYLSGIAEFLVYLIDIAGILVLAFSLIKTIVRDSLKFYRDFRILWIAVHRDIREAQEKADHEE